MAANIIQIPDVDFISEREFANLIGKSLRTVRRWQVERRGPNRTVLGRSVFYSKQAIQDFMQRQEQEVLPSSHEGLSNRRLLPPRRLLDANST